MEIEFPGFSGTRLLKAIGLMKLWILVSGTDGARLAECLMNSGVRPGCTTPELVEGLSLTRNALLRDQVV